MSLHELTPKTFFQALLQPQNSPIGPKKNLKMIPKYKKMGKSENQKSYKMKVIISLYK